MENTIKELRDMLSDKMKIDGAPGILFSGGLDSSVLAYLRPQSKAITVSLDSSGEDIGAARAISEFLGMELHHVDISAKEALETVPEVIKILRSFDPALPNDMAVYFGLRQAKNMGITKMIAGDGSDELFAGYDYMRDISDLDAYIKRISREMVFNSNIIGDYFGIEMVQPFIERDVVELALSISRDWKIKKDKDNIHGKWILRKAFEGALPEKFIWQRKRPLEVGSGMANMRRMLSEKISQEELQKTQYKIKFFNREHLYYYKVYRSVIGDVPPPKDGEERCVGCGTGILPSSIHCRVCGYVYDWK
ncbi:MAG: asparagine synthase C-terminal domain-containing protein [Candidatus Omnitrophota bacterium]